MLFCVLPRSSNSAKFTVMMLAIGIASLFPIGGGTATEPAVCAAVWLSAFSGTGVAGWVFADEFFAMAAALDVATAAGARSGAAGFVADTLSSGPISGGSLECASSG